MFLEVEEKNQNGYADVYHICAQLDFLQGPPSPPVFPTILQPPSSVSKVQKENADLHNLKKSETTAFGTGMVPFFLRSLKCTV